MLTHKIFPITKQLDYLRKAHVLDILNIIQEYTTVTDIVTQVKLNQSTVSVILNKLELYGYVFSKKNGRFALYKANVELLAKVNAELEKINLLITDYKNRY